MAVNTLLSSMREKYLIVVTIFIAIYILYTRYQKGLSNIPGPWLNSISPLPRLWSVWLGYSHSDDLKLHSRYGKLVRVSPTTISLSDPHEIEQIYGISTKFIKSEFYKPVTFYDEEGVIPDTFVLTDKTLHSRMKRNGANAYSLNALIKLEPLVEGVIDRLFSKIEEEYADKGKVCDIGNMMHCFAMDTIFTVTFGKDLKFVENGDSSKMLQALDDAQAYMALVGQVPWTHAIFGNAIVTKLFPGSSHHFIGELMTISLNETKAALEKVDQESNGPLTFLQQLLINQQKNPSLITDREISTHTFGNVFAGSDTTSIALRSIILHLLQNPSKYAKLVHEIRKSARLTLPVSFTTANKLPYLNAVIKEGMRLHPSVGMILGRTVPAGGATIGGKYVAAGVEVGVNPWIVHRDPIAFPDPEAFHPERWLTADADQLSKMNRAFFVFGAGAHTCSGKHISIMEITKLIPSMLVKFDLALESPFAGVRVKNHFFMGMYGLRVEVKMAV